MAFNHPRGRRRSRSGQQTQGESRHRGYVSEDGEKIGMASWPGRQDMQGSGRAWRLALRVSSPACRQVTASRRREDLASESRKHDAMADFQGADGSLRASLALRRGWRRNPRRKLLGWRTVCAVEYDAYAASVLCARQNDGILEPFPSGMTYEPLTADRGEELLTWYRAGFRAKTSRPQVKAPGSTASDQDCGRKWPASLAKYDRVSRSWKTRQCLLGGLEEFSATLARWGSMLWGVVSAADAIWLAGDPCLYHEREKNLDRRYQNTDAEGRRRTSTNLHSFEEYDQATGGPGSNVNDLPRR